jgi:predicted Zn-dependent peptidase
MRLVVRNRTFGLPDDFHTQLGPRLAEVTLDQVNAAIRRWLHPDSLTTVVVATASDIVDALTETAAGPIEIAAFDSY